MQYEQKLLQPYIIETHALAVFSLYTGMSSAILPSLSIRLITRSFLHTALYRISGNWYSECVPKITDTCLYFDFSFFTMCSCCIIQPQMPTIKSGRLAFKCFSAPTLPRTRISAPSRTAQVLNRIKSASSRLSVKAKPISDSMPLMRSESFSFCWQP